MGPALPLAGLQVVDIGLGHAAALITKFMAEAGATVVRLEPAGRDPFRDIYPAYAVWRNSLTEVSRAGPQCFAELVERADILVSGGERVDGSPYGEIETAMGKLPERLIELRISPGLQGGPFADLSGADLLIQAETGIVFEMLADRPMPMAISPSAYGAVFQSLIGICAALLMREQSGRGQIVSVGLAEAAITMMAPLWASAQKAPAWFHFRTPKAARPLIFECADGAMIHIVLGSAGSKYRLYNLLGIDDPTVQPGDAGLPNPANPPEHFFGNIEVLSPKVAQWRSTELLAALASADIAAGRVLLPGEIWDHPQVLNNDIIGQTENGSRFVQQPVRWAGGNGKSSVERPDPEGILPLSGLKVVDFGGFVAGPFASVGLADLGAEVIKVEPIGGDALRPAYPFFAAANRGKKSIALDLKVPEGLRIAAELARSADVVCSNFKTGVAERLGIDPVTLHGANGRAIVLLNSGYGLSGPLAAAPAFDPLMQAECGLEARNGGEGNEPLLNPSVLADFSGGYLGQIGVLMALYHRARCGQGMAIEVPLLNAALFLVSDVLQLADGSWDGPLALSNDRTGFHPTQRLYEALDGWIAVSARTAAQLSGFSKLVGVDATIDVGKRRWTSDEIDRAEAWFAVRAVSDLKAILAEHGVPASLCNSAAHDQILHSDALVKQGTIFSASRPALGEVRGCGIGFRLSEVEVEPIGSLPAIGEHGAAILCEMGYSPASITHLQDEGVVRPSELHEHQQEFVVSKKEEPAQRSGGTG